MIQLTDEMRHRINNARVDGYPCIMATASPEGLPNAGYRGSLMVFDDESLAYRERGQLSARNQLEENPKVVVLFRDSRSEVGWKFRCTATLHSEGPVYQQVMDRLVELGYSADPQSEGVAVVLHVDQVLTLFGEVLQEREPNLRW
jgi:hypothetical protein